MTEITDELAATREALERTTGRLDEEKFYRRRTFWTLIGAVIVVGLVVLGAVLVVVDITSDTRHAVKQTIPGLERQIERQEQTIDDYEAVLGDAVGHITRICGPGGVAEGECGLIELKPPER